VTQALEPLPEGTVVGQAIELWRDLGPLGDGHLYLGVDESGERPLRRLVLARSPQAAADLRVAGAPSSHPAIPAVVQVCEERGQRLLVLDCLPGTGLHELQPVADDELMLRLGGELAGALLQLAALGGGAEALVPAAFVLLPSGTVRYIGPVIAGDGLVPGALSELLTALAEGSAGWTDEVAAALATVGDPEVARERFAALLAAAPTGSAAGVSSDIGPIRRRNEDSAAHVLLRLAAEAAPIDLELVAVADGMGGHRAGDLASRVALSTFVSDLLLTQAIGQMEQRPLCSVSGDALKAALDSAFAAAGETVDALAEEDETAPPGTTLVAALRLGRRLLIGNLGDSRGYLIRDGAVQRLTRDDSYVQQLIEAGTLSEQDARDDPRSHFITQCVGLGRASSPSYQLRFLRAGDRVVLCSDGISERLTDTHLATVLQAFAGAQEAADALVWAAQEAGGTDNLTAVVLDLEGE